jgi:hypothetical protein
MGDCVSSSFLGLRNAPLKLKLFEKRGVRLLQMLPLSADHILQPKKSITIPLLPTCDVNYGKLLPSCRPRLHN